MTDLTDGKSLLFGTMELIDPNRTDFTVEVVAEGTTWGNPQPIEVAIRSLMQQGSNVITRGWNNRDGTGIRVKFAATDLDKIAVAEAELFAQIGRRNTVTWTPPGGLGAPTQFVIITSSLDHMPNDLAEILYPPSAQYSIRLIPEPFPRSTITLSAPALSVSGETRVQVDDGSSVTGWTGTPNAPSVDSGHIRVQGSRSGTISETRTGSIDTSVLKFLEIEWRVETVDGEDLTTKVPLRAFVGDRELPRAAQSRSAGSDALAVFLVPDDVEEITELRMSRIATVDSGPDPTYLFIGNIAVSDIRPSIGTARQLNQVIAVEGSAPAEGTLVVEHETDPLGDLIAYVAPELNGNYLPALGPRRVGGGSGTVEAGTVSGSFYLLLPVQAYDIPVSDIVEGTHVLMARVRYTGGTPEVPQPVEWSAQTMIDGVAVGEASTGSGVIDFSEVGADAWTVVVFGDLQLPDWQVSDNSTAVVRVELGSTVDADWDLQIDEAWLFNVDVGYLTHVRCGIDEDGVGPTRVRLLPATIEANIPKVLMGTAEDASDAYHPDADQLGSWMPPYFEPPSVQAFTVTTNALNAKVSLEHQPRWHTRARRVAGQ